MSSPRPIGIVGLVCRCRKMSEVDVARAVRREGPETHRRPDRVHRPARAGCHAGERADKLAKFEKMSSVFFLSTVPYARLIYHQ